MRNGIPDVSELGQYDVNRPGQTEGIKWSIYDQQAYPQAGTTQLQFFQIPRGASSKTFADTNMVLAGTLPQPQRFLITGVELYFFPAVTVLPYVKKLNSASATVASTESFVNDTWLFYSSAAFLQLDIGSKAYLQEAPLLKFPPSGGLSVNAAVSDTTTLAGAQLTTFQYATAGGPTYDVLPPLLLIANQNFNLSLNWNALVPISAAAKVMTQLNGFLYRLSQ